jgi:hypothetical protein
MKLPNDLPTPIGEDTRPKDRIKRALSSACVEEEWDTTKREWTPTEPDNKHLILGESAWNNKYVSEVNYRGIKNNK